MFKELAFLLEILSSLGHLQLNIILGHLHMLRSNRKSVLFWKSYSLWSI